MCKFSYLTIGSWGANPGGGPKPWAAGDRAPVVSYLTGGCCGHFGGMIIPWKAGDKAPVVS